MLGFNRFHPILHQALAQTQAERGVPRRVLTNRPGRGFLGLKGGIPS